MDELLARLLRKEPRARYHARAAVLADVEAIRAALGRGAAEVDLVVGRADARTTLTDPALVERGDALVRLLGELDDGGAPRRGAAPSWRPPSSGAWWRSAPS